MAVGWEGGYGIVSGDSRVHMMIELHGNCILPDFFYTRASKLYRSRYALGEPDGSERGNPPSPPRAHISLLLKALDADSQC